MKKIALIIALAAVSSIAFSQAPITGQGYLKSTPTHAVTDTAVATTPLNQYFTLPGYWDQVTVQSTFTKISGTVAGTVSLFGSIDNVGFSLISSANTLTDGASQTFTWVISPSSYKYYKITVTPTGTSSAKWVSPILWRRRPVK